MWAVSYRNALKIRRNRYDRKKNSMKQSETAKNLSLCCEFPWTFGCFADSRRKMQKTLEYIYIYIIGCAKVRFSEVAHFAFL